MNWKESIIIGAITSFIIISMSYKILTSEILVTDISQSLSIQKILPYLFLFVVSVVVAVGHSYFGGIQYVTIVITLSTFIGITLGFSTAVLQYNTRFEPLVILPILAFIAGIGMGVPISKIEPRGAS